MPGFSCKPFPTFRLFEAIDKPEFNALTTGNKDLVRMILSCGVIDMNVGSFIRDKLFEIFPDGTTTYTNLMELLSYTPPNT